MIFKNSNQIAQESEGENTVNSNKNSGIKEKRTKSAQNIVEIIQKP